MGGGGIIQSFPWRRASPPRPGKLAILVSSLGTLWIFTPVYLDAESFLLLRARILEELAKGPARFEAVGFVVVDDSAGVDPAISSMEDLPDVTVVTPPFNLGHQRAIVYALRMVRDGIDEKDVIVTMDSDGEDRPEDLSRLVDALCARPESRRVVVLARRTTRDVSVVFRLMYLVFVVLFRVLTGRIVRSGNFATYRGWLVKQVVFHPNFDLTYSASLISLNLDIAYVDCPRGSRYFGRSRMTYVTLVGHGIGMLMPFLDRIAVRALFLFGGLSSAAALLGVAALLSAALEGSPWVDRLLAMAPYAFILVSLGAVQFLALFASYAQSRGGALRALDPSDPASRSVRLKRGNPKD